MIQEIMRETLENARPAVAQGEVASYIPELKKADKNQLGLSILRWRESGIPWGIRRCGSASRVFPR